MLNHFKIGVKLFAGFTAVLALLVLVGLAGWWAVHKKTNMYNEVDTANVLSQSGLVIQRSILDTLVTANQETFTRKQEFADQVQEKTAEIKKAHQDDAQRILDPDIRKKYQTILQTIDAFASSDAENWQYELKRQKAMVGRKDWTAKTNDNIKKLEKYIEQRIAEQQTDTANNVSFISMVRNVDGLNNNVAELRRLYREYELVPEEEKAAVRKRVMDTYKLMENAVAALKSQMEADEAQKIIADLEVTNKKWLDFLLEVMQHEDAFIAGNARTAKIAEEMVAGINELLPIFHESEQAVKKESQNFDRYVLGVIMGTTISAVLFGLFISYVLTFNITSGIRRAVRTMATVAHDGNVLVEVAHADRDRKDEIGDLTRALSEVIKQFQNVERLAEELANGNYNLSTEVRGDQDTMNIYLNKMLDQVNNVMHEINESVMHVATSSGEVSSAAQNLSNGAQASAASLQEITASMNEIGSQTKKNAEGAVRARDLAQKASKAAAEGQTAMQDMTAAMGLITQNSHEIQRVIKVIDDIAFQTNLLALNAAVEAARAGQHGKGFAVVAEEVRNLAARSAKAAKETSELIVRSNQEIEKGAGVAEHTAGVLNTIVEQVQQTTGLIADIATASNEQAAGVNQVSVGLHQIDSVTQQNTAAAEESASAAHEMSSLAVELQKETAQFKLRK